MTPHSVAFSILLALSLTACVRVGFESRSEDIGSSGDGGVTGPDLARELGGSWDGALERGGEVDGLLPDLPLPLDASRADGAQPLPTWVKSVGASDFDVVSGVAVDSSGNLTICGVFTGTLDLGGGPLVSSGSQDLFLASYSAAGAHRWSRRFGGSGGDSANALAVDASGNVYLTGDFTGEIDFGGGARASAGGQDIFLASFTPDGVHRFSSRFGGAGNDYGHGVTAHQSGAIYLTGNFFGTVDFGGGALSNAGWWDIFLASFTTAGTYRWAQRFGTGTTSIGYGVATDSSGNVYLSGTFQNAVDFGGGSLPSAGSWDAFVASFSGEGLYRWAHAFGDTAEDESSSVAIDSNGNVWITGYFNGTANFGGADLTSAGSWDIYLASFGPDGVHRFSKGFGGTEQDQGYRVVADDGGNVILTGYFSESVDLGGGILSSAGQTDILLSSYDGDGAHRWSARFGGIGADFGIGGAFGAAVFYLSGYFSGVADFAGEQLTSAAGSVDGFLLKLAL